MHKLALPFALLTGLAATSCLDLPGVEGGTCGNKIIDAHEDCDGASSAPEGTVCRAAGSVGACRYDCGPGSSCPEGYGCGSDSICRAHSGAFTDVGTSVSMTPTHLVVDDFDGDGRSDLLAYDYYAGEVKALFVEPSGAPAKLITMASDSMIPSTGKLAGGASSTFTFAAQSGMGVMRGQSDRSFSPTAYTSLQLPWADGHIVNLDAMPPASPDDPRWLGDEVMIFHGAFGFIIEEENVTPNEDGLSTLRLPSNKAPVGPVRVGHIDTDASSPCEEIVLTYGDDKVHVVTPCRHNGEKVVWNRTDGAGSALSKTYPPVTLFDQNKQPVEAKIAKVFLTHLNAPLPDDPMAPDRDEDLDLVINAFDESRQSWRVFAAYGAGNGHFAGRTPSLEAVPDGAVERVDLEGPYELLAVGDLDLDGYPDFVFPNGIFLTRDGGRFEVGIPRIEYQGWSDAVIADMNGDGLPDVMCGVAYGVGIDFFTNAGGGVFNRLLIPTDKPATGFVVGDFDGDLTRDVAFRLGSTRGELGITPKADEVVLEADQLGVIFGRFGQPPEPPRSLGELAQIEQIFAGRTIVNEAPSDGMSDLGVISRSLVDDTVLTVAVFQGRGDRVLQSPFEMRGADPFSTRKVLTTAVGHFDDSDNAQHLDVAAVVSEQPYGSDGPTRHLLWFLPSTSAAALDISTARSIALPLLDDPRVDWSTAELATIDIDGDGDGDGADEVAIIAAYYDAQQVARIAVSVARRGSDGKPEIVGPFALQDELYSPFSTFVGIPLPGLDARPPACVADLDGDGKKDLAILAYDETPAPRVVVLWGTGDTSAPFEASRARVPIEGDFAAAYTCADVVPDAGHELVVLSVDRAYSVDFDERTPKDKVRLAGVDSGNAVASGDFDGDGIADLFVSTFSGLRVYRGAPVIP